MNYNDDDIREEMKADAHQHTYDDLEDFAVDNPVSEYASDAASSLIENDDRHYDLIESCGQQVMRLMLRLHGHGEGLPPGYDDNLRIRDEADVATWLGREIEKDALVLQENAWRA